MVALFILLNIMVSPMLQRGDDLFVRQEYQRAISSYNEHLKTNPGDARALWRVSRAYISMGDVAKKDERESLYRLAEEYATRAVHSDSLSSAAHTWRAVSLGYIALFEGSRTKVRLCNEIQQELDCAIRLDSTNDVAYSIYGTFFRALGKVNWFERTLANMLLGGLPAGDFNDAVRSLKKAIKLAPTIIRHRYELGMVYLDLDRTEDAKKVFLEALQLPPLLASDAQRIERMKRRVAEK
ncbi:MAG: tetratricopeptide repeat protein [Bacteroidota bacterium]|jgi:tetratricopeptide (TPR) repeat protein